MRKRGSSKTKQEKKEETKQERRVKNKTMVENSKVKNKLTKKTFLVWKYKSEEGGQECEVTTEQEKCVEREYR